MFKKQQLPFIVCLLFAGTWLNIFYLFFHILKNLFIIITFGCIGSSLLRMGFPQLRRAGGTLCCGAWPSHCGGFSCCGVRALGTRASVAVAHRLSTCGSRALERRLSSRGTRAQLLHGMWDLPGPGLEPMSPALAGGFLTTAPPGKSQYFLFCFVSVSQISMCTFF